MRHYDGFMKTGKMKSHVDKLFVVLIKTKKEIDYIRESCQNSCGNIAVIEA